LRSFVDGSFSWENLEQFKNEAQMPLVIKGIMNVEDALKAKKYGADAIWVSNHGGR